MEVWKMQPETQGMGSGHILSEKCCVINLLIKRSKNVTCKQSWTSAIIMLQTDTSDWSIGDEIAQCE